MTTISRTFSISTHGKGTYPISEQVHAILQKSGVQEGLCTVFVRHTSASVIIYENADPSARTDLHAYFERIAPENADYFIHTDEGPDDMPSHLRMVLTHTSLSVPIIQGQLALGIWQGLFLFEHRRAPHVREVVVNILGN